METSEQIEKFIFENGKQYEPALLPEDLQRMEMHHCFDNCAKTVASNEKYTYVEGFAIDPRTGEKILHAWLTDGIHAFDITWHAYKGEEQVAIPFAYFGIEVPREKVFIWYTETQYAGILANSWRFPLLAVQMFL